EWRERSTSYSDRTRKGIRKPKKKRLHLFKHGKFKSAHTADSNIRPAPDKELVDIADYVTDYKIASDEAYDTARYCLMDSLGCAFLALKYPECVRHLGPIVPGTVVPHGARVPGTNHVLDPVKAA